MMHLYSHNQQAYTAAVRMLSERGKAAVIHPTGTGKSFIGFKLCEDNPDKTILWLSPSRYIYQTQLENLAETSDGYQPQNVIFHTYAKLVYLTKEEIADIKPDFIILDEFHRAGAEMWGSGVNSVLSAYPDVPVLGLSATAIRYLDNQRDMSDELFDGNIASEMTLGEAIVRGILNPPKYILSIYSYQKNLEEYEKRIKLSKSKATTDKAKEYLEALRRALDKAESLDVMFDKHMADRTGKYIVFCANLEHMQDMMDKAYKWFHRVDKKPHMYSVYSDDPTASKSFADFKADNDEKHLKLLFCIDALNEGVHVPDVTGVILLRPTVSPIIYKQQIGRALSASKSKEPIIFDIVNNIENLYSIDSVETEMKAAVMYYRSHGESKYIVNETFEVIDKVSDCREIFGLLEGTLSASWNTMYEVAKRYYEANGDLDVPKRYYTPEGYSLGLWIMTQRRVYKGTVSGVLTQAQIDKLNDIGMVWDDVNDRSWRKYYPAAVKYYEKNGDLNVPGPYVDEDGIDLGRWILQVRSCRNSGIRLRFLTEERVNELDKIGMVWDTFNYLFENYYHSAVLYHKKYGDLNVPYDYVDEQGIKLGGWCSRIRKGAAKELTDEQKSRLDKLGMIWCNKRDERWENAYRALCEYKEKYGNLDVPKEYVTDNGIKLGTWLYYQKTRSNDDMSPERREKLSTLGVFDEQEKNVIAPERKLTKEELLAKQKAQRWMKRFVTIKRFYEEHAHLEIPPDVVIDRYKPYNWLKKQKKLLNGHRELLPEQIEMLASVGIYPKQTVKDDKWLLRYGCAKKYYEEHGHLNVPNDEKTSDGVSLAYWISKQKADHRRGELSDEHSRLLAEIGLTDDEIDVNYTDKLWNTGFEHMKEYMLRFGTKDGAYTYICDDGYNLGNWITRNAHKFYRGELTEEQIRALTEIGVVFSKESAWNTHFEELRSYVEEHHTVKIPEKYISQSGIKLCGWLNDQKKYYRKGRLSPEKVEKLTSLGVTF